MKLSVHDTILPGSGHAYLIKADGKSLGTTTVFAGDWKWRTIKGGDEIEGRAETFAASILILLEQDGVLETDERLFSLLRA